MIFFRLLILQFVLMLHISYVANTTCVSRYETADQSDSKAVLPADQPDHIISNMDTDCDESSVLTTDITLAPSVASHNIVRTTEGNVYLYSPHIWSPPQVS